MVIITMLLKKNKHDVGIPSDNQKPLSKYFGRNRAFFLLASILAICAFAFFILLSENIPPVASRVLYAVIPLFGGVCFTLFLSPPGKNEASLIEELVQETLKNSINTAVSQAPINITGEIFPKEEFAQTLKEAMAESIEKGDFPCAEEMLRITKYKINHITSSVYDTSKQIFKKIDPQEIKIVMKAEEFSFEGDDARNLEAIEWFDFLNNHVKETGKKYTRVISVFPTSQEDAEKNLKWIKQMCDRLSRKNVKNGEIKVDLRDLTISWVLLDRKVSFFAFLIHNKFDKFVELSSKNNGGTIITEINTWFDQKFDNDLGHTYSIYRNGNFDEDNFKKFSDILEYHVKKPISSQSRSTK